MTGIEKIVEVQGVFCCFMCFPPRLRLTLNMFTEFGSHADPLSLSGTGCAPPAMSNGLIRGTMTQQLAYVRHKRKLFRNVGLYSPDQVIPFSRLCIQMYSYLLIKTARFVSGGSRNHSEQLQHQDPFVFGPPVHTTRSSGGGVFACVLSSVRKACICGSFFLQ